MPLQLALSLQAHFAYGALIGAGGRVAGDVLEVIAQSAGDHRKWCLARSLFYSKLYQRQTWTVLDCEEATHCSNWTQISTLIKIVNVF